MEHLQRRGLRLYFRLAIPRDIQRFFDGRRELRRGLRCECYTDAKPLVRAELYRAERLFARIRGGSMDAEQNKKLVADAILEGAGLTMDRGSHDYRKLLRETLKGVIAATRIELQRMKGDYRSEPFSRASAAPST